MKNRFIVGIVLSIVSLMAVSAYNMPYTVSVVSKGTFISPDAGIQYRFLQMAITCIVQRM